MSAEWTLVRCLSTPMSADARRVAFARLYNDIDLTRFFALAEAWELEPFIMHNLLRLDDGSLPTEVRDQVKDLATRSRAVTVSRGLAAVDLAARMVEQGIDVLVLKGPALGARAYGDPSLRPFGDIDLMVRPRDLLTASKLLLSLGYEREYDQKAEPSLIRWGHALEFRRQSLKVELHCALVSHHLRFQLDHETAFRDRTTIACCGGKIDVLSLPHEFLFICAHGAKHAWERVRWICDLAHLGRRLSNDDAAAITVLASAFHLRRVLALGIQLVENVLEVELPQFPASLRQRDETTRPLITSIRVRLGLPPGTPNVPPGRDEAANIRHLRFWISARERLIDRLMSIAWVSIVPTEKDFSLGSLGWIARPLRLAYSAATRRARA